MAQKKKRTRIADKPVKYPKLYKHPYWKVFMIANPVLLITVLLLIVMQVVPLPVGVGIGVVGYILLWQLVRIARREVQATAKNKKKKVRI